MQINGVINVYKEKGYTSHDVVAKLRGILHQKKIGHTGTLDPDAEGVLPVCLGRGTKLCDVLADHDKEYEAVLLLGTVTDTQDITGTVIRTSPVSMTEDEIRECILSFRGEQMQIPPMYSALKVGGKKLYEMAREGIEIERKPRPVHFYDIEVIEMELPRVKIRVHCSKGTYIRTLCHDIGEKLGCGGCMEQLLRTRVERFELLGARKLSQIQVFADMGKIEDIVVPVDQMFDAFSGCKVTQEADRLVHNGNFFPISLLEKEDIVRNKGEQLRIYDSTGEFIGIFTKKGERMTPVKMFYSKDV
ncbi:MAG: tRNA pseudouridine(55) synthase TruB [Oliverpabstia sp.]|nr:tRNA pseudouridine(55) synthase TruB [Oliverpabstia sp.]